MFYALAFFPSFDNMVCVRSLRRSGYKTADAARRALERRKVDGYVKKVGHAVPIWSNVK